MKGDRFDKTISLIRNQQEPHTRATLDNALKDALQAHQCDGGNHAHYLVVRCFSCGLNVLRVWYHDGVVLIGCEPCDQLVLTVGVRP